ncbi:olfactory receptor 11H6-like [Nematolebias whitei]|uniref:olfactory receptor 11H6-like n=1 Tax=Nematolebias whitei TaxID=451745 RepID=UPI001898C21C|nr:olfactory receptor 11H6-like [Nematolebias whitei]
MMNNISTISVFFLSGINEIRNYRSTLFFFTLMCYCLIILVNAFLIVMIILDNAFHEPMYIMLCAFCMNSLYGTAGFYPKFLWDLLSPVHVISYSGCLFQALVMYSFASCELSILALMAYDRYLAICRPLQYHTVMTKHRVVKLVYIFWLTPVCINSVSIVLTSRLKLCSSFINKLICVNWSIVALACFPADMIVNSIVSYLTILIYVLHAVFIVWTYMYLIKTCLGSIENRAKFMQTCVPHLVSLVIFIVILLIDLMSMRFGFGDLPQTVQNFIAIEFLIIPPMMNPLIYGFKLTKMRKKILHLAIFKVK